MQNINAVEHNREKDSVQFICFSVIVISTSVSTMVDTLDFTIFNTLTLYYVIEVTL